jgi:hypothetical protein
MTFSAHGLDGFLLFLALVCFVICIITAWVRPMHRLWFALLPAGLFLWCLTALVS